MSQFVDRNVEMKKIEQFLLPHNKNDPRKTFVLHGLGGIGKTQLALAFARKHQHDYSAIFWLDGESRESLRQSIAAIAKRLPSGHISKSARRYGQKDSEEVEKIIQEMMDWFGKSGNTKWLLIYDNVDRDSSSKALDPEAYDVDQYLPPIDQGSVIITTRQLRLRSQGAETRLPGMTPDEALKVLESRIGLSLSSENIPCPLVVFPN